MTFAGDCGRGVGKRESLSADLATNFGAKNRKIGVDYPQKNGRKFSDFCGDLKWL